MTRFGAAGLYVVTSAEFSAGRGTIPIVKSALAAGVKLIQLREKNSTMRELINLGRTVRDMTARAGALLIINDRIDIAMAIGADGVHLGRNDLPTREARAIAPDMIIGASTHNRSEALSAEADGASYVNLGPVFPTKTKDHLDSFIGMEGVKEISKLLSIPFTVMGGIKKNHIPDLVSLGVRTIAVVTAVTAAPDPEKAARELLALIRGG
ncbi:MAG: thiamine phosphate synthase [Lentisphaerae bacterium]|nr:thiamine phosphate synthase [Lentisphaerota bacterium]